MIHINQKQSIVKIFIFSVSLFVACLAKATEVLEVLPVTRSVLLVHFDDGYVQHHQAGQKKTDDKVFIIPVDERQLMIPQHYLVSSPDDKAYFLPQVPLEISRKSKGTDFAWICNTYKNGCINTEPDRAKEHWVYIFLPAPLQTGKKYEVNLAGLGKGIFSFVYDEMRLHSEAIHVNNLGYATAATQKFGYFYLWLGSKGSLESSGFNHKPFFLMDSLTRKIVFTGTIRFRKSRTNVETARSKETPGDNFSGADVCECDFSAFNQPGNYYLVIPGAGRSYPFKIAADAFREPYFWVMKGLFQNRSGIALQAPFTDKPRPAPHHPLLTPGFAGRLKYTSTRYFDLIHFDQTPADKPTIERGYKGTLNTFGWYQDAGDWDSYYVHSHVPAYLLFLYEAGRNKFLDNELQIPESGNGIPDLLDEAAWLLRFYKRTRDEITNKGYGTGGVAGARVTGDLWGADTQPDGTTQASWQDIGRDWYVSGEDPWMSYKYAAMAAQLAFILKSEGLADPENTNWEQEAVQTYIWAMAHTRSGDEQEKFGVQLLHIRMYAAAALYRLTGFSAYHEDFKKLAARFLNGELNPEYPDPVFSAWIYTLLPVNRTADTKLLAHLTIAITRSADKTLLEPARARACRWGGDFTTSMMVGQATTPMVGMGIYAWLVNKNQHPGKAAGYLAALHTTADYFLGCNPLNTTWISGIGEKHPVGIFHLDWWYSGQPGVIKGIVPYGPAIVIDTIGTIGPWNHNFAYRDLAHVPSVFPENINEWPGHERWFDQRNAPFTCEFTIHQNAVIAAFVYGFLTQDKTVKKIYPVAGRQ